ncbi:riboflavin synthase [Aerococcus sp. HMSC10H05]|uniref:riboflavin synthase n=1 Tax=Aerococcus sp. HMSC10H05 TaxID=1581084 RepID=UPI0008A3D53E|nr:riboflavin synthase [Aerococcus sp. HMSC10H05]OFU53267.1 riboflavin synthase subunit alpha [Aerococcus sp. HMSC10H05]
MFTGIIEDIGRIESIKAINNRAGLFLTIASEKIVADVNLGDSISVNGICLTVMNYTDTNFQVEVMPETIAKTSLEGITRNSQVNLERAMKANARFGGHLVSGHIDGIGKITAIEADGIANWYTIQTSKDLMRYIIMKGSIAIDGTSLTVAGAEGDSFKVSIIPHTSEQTIFSTYQVGTIVNLENDIVGKYIEQFTVKERV